MSASPRPPDRRDRHERPRVAPGSVGRGEPLDLTRNAGLTGLVLVASLVALGTIVEVFGHEIVGFRHTLRAVGGRRPEVQPEGT